jgi:hypothetical protein
MRCVLVCTQCACECQIQKTCIDAVAGFYSEAECAARVLHRGGRTQLLPGLPMDCAAGAETESAAIIRGAS